MAIKGKIKLNWEIAEDGMSFFLTGTAIEQDGTVKEAECEVNIDDFAEAYPLEEALYEIAHDIFEEDIEEALKNDTIDKPENKRLKQLNLCDECFGDEDEDLELINDLFDSESYEEFIDEYNEALSDYDEDEDDEEEDED